jgi:hypothetical protein
VSTHAIVNFVDGRTVVAKVFKHSDGYPLGESGMRATLERFFDDVERHAAEGGYGADTRFDDMTALAAKYVVWQAAQEARGAPLNFGGEVRVLMVDYDAEHIYSVRSQGEDVRPKVTHRKAR